jgi:hypothetical protein
VFVQVNGPGLVDQAASRITSTRSARPSTSGTSLDTSSTPTPSSASERITPYSSARAPTSTSRVGSSSSSSLVAPSNQRPRTTFCWLPPDSVRAGRRTSGGTSWSAPVTRAASARSAAASVNPALAKRGNAASVTLR